MRIPTGEELRDARTERGLTQAQLADRADLSQPLIARVESGDVDSRLGTLHSIVSALNGSEVAFEQEEIELVMPVRAQRQPRRIPSITGAPSQAM